MTVETTCAVPCSTTSPVSVDSAKIMKQVEFYFSDYNMPRDRFLQEEAKKNEEGWIALSVIASFKRMQVLTNDVAIIAEALKSSEFVEVSADGLSVRRTVALPETPVDCMKTCVLVKGFEVEGTSLEKLEQLFAGVVSGGSEGVASIRMRRNKQSKAFKGSVFLTLKSEEEAKRLVELKTIPLNESVNLEIMDMTTFMEEQNAKHLARNSKKSDESSTEPEEPMTLEDVKQMVLTVTGCPVDLDHRLLRTALSSKGPVAFVENVTPEGFSVVRFKEPVASDLIASITAENGMRMPGIEEPLQVREPTADEVQAFFTKMQEFKAKAAANGGNNGKHRNYHNKNKRVRRA